MQVKDFINTYCFAVVIALFLMLLFCASTQINTYNASSLSGSNVQNTFKTINSVLIAVSTLLFVAYLVIKFLPKKNPKKIE